MDVLRTPDERFTNLPGYAFTPHYLEVDGLRIHHVDEGPRGAPPVLLLHGEPSWSYLYRRMIPLLTAAGFRAVAPDLVGFGRSDKPASPADYTYQRHAGCVTELAAEVIAVYDAPFPDERYKAGARRFPLLVPTSPDDPAAPANRRAWEALRRWEKPFLTAFSDSDPITHGADAFLREAVPGARGQPHTIITGAGHFLQEDRGEEMARVVLDFIRLTEEAAH